MVLGTFSWRGICCATGNFAGRFCDSFHGVLASDSFTGWYLSARLAFAGCFRGFCHGGLGVEHLRGTVSIGAIGDFADCFRDFFEPDGLVMGCALLLLTRGYLLTVIGIHGTIFDS